MAKVLKKVIFRPRGLEPFSEAQGEHFSELIIERYRGLSELRLADLRRINVVAGPNNAGKTSVLEAAYLLSQQHDVNALFQVMRSRGRLTELNPEWVFEQAPRDARIRGRFGSQDATLHIRCDYDESQVKDSTDYVGSIFMDATFGEHTQSSRVHLLIEGRRTPPRRGNNVLCRALLSSPFSQHDSTMLTRLYERSVETRTKEKVIQFLREKVDDGLQNIELANEMKRFLVTHRDLDHALDLTSFGEGLQRIFHIGLLFSWARDGLVLIDELENAIHASLLVDFTGFLVQLAREFNVQVFATTHSKECIDALVYGGEHLEDIGYYSIKREKTGTRCEHVTAEELAKMLEAVAYADIRRLR
jgi:predicted ATPase